MIPTSPPQTSCGFAWCPVGSTLMGRTLNDLFGWTLALSADGQSFAVGSNRHDDQTGLVQVYRWSQQQDAWIQQGQDLTGRQVKGDHFGSSASLSANGQFVAAGAYFSSVNGPESGQVHVYQWNDTTQQWDPRGAAVPGEAAGDFFGWSVSLATDGTTLAVVADRNDSPNNGKDAGHVRVYGWKDGNQQWEQMGQYLEGDDANDGFGIALSLTANGQTVTAGANRHNDAKGHVKVYQWNPVTQLWEPFGQDLDGAAPGDRFGASVSIMEEGGRFVVAVGAMLNDAKGTNSGHVRLYQWNDVVERWE